MTPIMAIMAIISHNSAIRPLESGLISTVSDSARQGQNHRPEQGITGHNGINVLLVHGLGDTRWRHRGVDQRAGRAGVPGQVTCSASLSTGAGRSEPHEVPPPTAAGVRQQ